MVRRLVYDNYLLSILYKNSKIISNLIKYQTIKEKFNQSKYL